MGSKANDSRMGTTGLPSTSGISFRLTPAPEAVIKTSSAPTRTGSATLPSAVARPPTAPAPSRVRRCVSCADLVMGIILLVEPVPVTDREGNACGTRPRMPLPRPGCSVESLGRRSRHVLDRNQVNRKQHHLIRAPVFGSINDIRWVIDGLAGVDRNVPFVGELLHASVSMDEIARTLPRADECSRFDVD